MRAVAADHVDPALLDLVGRGAQADPIYAQLQAQFPEDPGLKAALAARSGGAK